MAIPSITQIGHSGLKAAKAGISTAGHNIANASTEGFSRQRVLTEASEPSSGAYGKNFFGTGVAVARVERVNDEFVEKQIRNANRDMAQFQEKDLALNQIEEVFNEMGGDGLNRVIAKFFNDFRKLSEEPASNSLKTAVLGTGRSLTTEFHRIEKQISGVRGYLDSRIEVCVGEVNTLARDLADLNARIRVQEVTGGQPNELLDQRDSTIKKLSAYMELNAFKDNKGSVSLDIRGVGPLVVGERAEKLDAVRSSADSEGKSDGTLDIVHAGALNGITHLVKGGKLGALLETRDQLISSVLGRLDELAFGFSEAVNEVHSQGYSATGRTCIPFFEPMELTGASRLIALSEELLANPEEIVTAACPDSPGDNRVALAISRLQNQKLFGDSSSTVDEWYNSIVSEVGSTASHNKFAMNREKDIVTQLGRVRDQISGVSVDEETTQLLEFQHTFDASAKLIQIADEMLKTILGLKRD